jgi:hypothetical protein
LSQLGYNEAQVEDAVGDFLSQPATVRDFLSQPATQKLEEARAELRRRHPAKPEVE